MAAGRRLFKEPAMFIEPTPEQIARLDQDGEGPVCMLNLLRLRSDGGREAYAEYGAGVLPLLAGVGGEVVWQGHGDSVVVGDDDADAWDLVLVVRYPSRAAFLTMITSAEYAAIAGHRTRALTDSRLIACSAL
jgi:uncharacterized protein (DUF1330 family)